MLSLLISTLYLTVLFIYVLASAFIIYHLIRYSAASEMKTLMLILFIAVSAGLLFSNLLLFFSIDWDAMLYKLIP